MKEEEQVVFARNSTGLVRQGRWLDAFIFNSAASWMFGTIIFSLSAIVYFNGANLISAEGIALIFALAIAAMYAILTSMMPRSGGDYVFNSRIVHPIFGFSFNFSLTVWQLFSASFTLYFISYVALAPGLEVLGYYASSKSVTQAGVWLGDPINSLIIATLVNILFTLVISTGIRRTFSLLDIVWFVTIAGTLAMIASLILTNQSSFATSFNGFMKTDNGTNTLQNSFSYFQKAVVSPSYHLSFPEVAIVADSVIWVFWTTYVAGEIRHANEKIRNVTAMAGAAILNAAFFAVLIYLLYNRVGIPFLSGVTSLAGTSIIPFQSPLQALSAVLILSTGNFYAGALVLVAITFGYSVLLLPALYLQPIRSVFAWSFDRLVPEKWSSVNERFHTPLLTTIGIFAVIEAGLVLITFEYNLLYGMFSAVVIAPAFSCIFPTAVAAIVLRFRRGTKWIGNETRSFNSYLITVLGVASLGFILFMAYIFSANEGYFYTSVGPLSSNILVMLNFVFIPIGALIYILSYEYRKRRNHININMVASEIPPE